MCLFKHNLISGYRFALNNSTVFPCLHHTVRSKFSKSRHNIEKNCFTNTLTLPSHSFVIASRATAHTKKFACWIDIKYFSVLSCIPLPKRQKCTGTKYYREDFKMVWISNLDNPEVKQVHFYQSIAGINQ